MKTIEREIEGRSKEYEGMLERDFVALVRELNGLAFNATNEGNFSIEPFRYVNTGGVELIECFEHPVWNSEDSEWDEHEEPLRTHILNRVDDFLETLAKFCSMRSKLRSITKEKS